MLKLLEEADGKFQLSQRERITLEVLAQGEGLIARELAQSLEVSGADSLQSWLGRLQALGLVHTAGKTRALRYFVAPEWLRGVRLDDKTTLTRITPYRLRALILEDLARYPSSASTEVNRRIGAEISAKTVKRALDRLIQEGRVTYSGKGRWRRYGLSEQEDKGHAVR